MGTFCGTFFDAVSEHHLVTVWCEFGCPRRSTLEAPGALFRTYFSRCFLDTVFGGFWVGPPLKRGGGRSGAGTSGSVVILHLGP